MRSSYVAPSTDRPTDNFSLIGVINFLMRNALFLLVGGVVVATLAAISRMVAPETYTSTTSFITEDAPSPGRLLGILPGAGSGRSPDFYVELIKSPVILGPLVEQRYVADSTRPPQTLVHRYGGSPTITQGAREAAMGKVLSNIGTKISVNGVITLRVTAETPLLAAGIAQGFLDQIDRFNNDRKRAQTSTEIRFAEQRMAEIEGEVQDAENRYRLFLERNRMIAQSPALQLQRDRLVDELGRKRALLSTLLQGYERAKLDESRESPRATLIAPPLPPLGPNPRGTTRIAILGFFLGVLLAGLLALAKDYFASIPRQTSPEASEFTELRARFAEAIRRPVREVAARVRRDRQSRPA